MKKISYSFIFATLITIAVYGLGYLMGWLTEVDPLEAFANWTTYACTILCVYQSRHNYWIGAISVAAFAVLFWQQNLLASSALQLYLFPIMAYGWWRWGRDDITRPVTSLGWDKWTAGYLGITVLVYLTTYWINTALGGSVAILDTALLVGSILAQFLMDNKKLENWIVWFLVDIFSVYEYWGQGLKVTAVQMALFAGNAVWAYYMWRQTQKEISL